MNQVIKKRIEDINNGIVPEGYKQTPFGIFPCDWETKYLDDICVMQGGGTPNTKKQYYWEGDIPWISSSNLNEDDFYNVNITRYITQEAVEKSATKICPSNSIAVVTRVGVGKVALIDRQYCTSQDFTNIIDTKCSTLYLLYQLKSAINRKLEECQGTSIKGITTKELQKLQINIPKKEIEQSKIAEILMKWDEMVELQEQYIQKLELRKKSIMKKLLTPKDGWKCVRFENTCKKFAYSKELQTNQYQVSGGYPVVDQGKNYIVAFTDEEDYIINNNCEGLLLFGDHTTEVKYLDFCFAVGGDGVKLFQKNGLYDLKFIYYSLLNTPFMIEGYKRHSNILRKKGIFVPFKNGELDIQEQNRIVDILTKLDKEISLQKEKLEKIKIQRKAMQQYLLTGIIRVL